MNLHLPQELVFLGVLFLLGAISKNQTIMISVIILVIVKYSGFSKDIFPYLNKNGVKIGIIFIMIAVLIPIATGEIKIVDLIGSMKSSNGIISLLAGIVVAILGSMGVQLLDKSPEITIAIITGVILSVIFLKGIPVGPLIGAGIAMLLIRIFDFFKTFIS